MTDMAPAVPVPVPVLPVHLRGVHRGRSDVPPLPLPGLLRGMDVDRRPPHRNHRPAPDGETPPIGTAFAPVNRSRSMRGWLLCST